ncbi:acyl-CoA N-acyltransferase [Penicillium angulare]|uniref:Acyl-CoA N-acyltransferase n=1 Tax=Penicillium angulare TaxID=116970 RepID=A0A9W9EVA8_9EURO|nr:acyl-CoA N-acyltransferase [Penicillium angulare]
MATGQFYYEQKRLENDLISLEPFDQTIHITKFFNQTKYHPDLLKYVDFPQTETEEQFTKEVYAPLHDAPGECLYAIIDKTKPQTSSTEPENQNAYAGTIALTNTDKGNAATEIGIMIFKDFQRTHVGTNAVGLLLQYTLDPALDGGLGLRRVEWKTHFENVASRNAALRMGFEFEGILRWHRAFSLGVPVEALEKRNGTSGELRGRHTAYFSIVWEEWDEKRPKVVALMQKKY